MSDLPEYVLDRIFDLRIPQQQILRRHNFLFPLVALDEKAGGSLAAPPLRPGQRTLNGNAQ